MKLAQYDIIAEKKSVNPILLLDDIFDRLDTTRVANLVALVSDDKFGQIFITDCDGERMAKILEQGGKEYKIFNIKNGEVE